MHSRRTARAAVISAIVVALVAVAGPAMASHDQPDDSYGSEESSEDYGSDERAGRSPDADLQVECNSVDATSPRKISTVTVYFADGTEEIIEVDEREYSGTFETTIDHAVAEARKEMAVDYAEDCEPEPSASPSGSAPEDGSGDGSDGTAAGTNGDDTQNGDTSNGDTSTRTATSSGDDGAGTGTRTASTTDTSSATATVAAPSTGAPAVGSSLSVGGNANVLGMVFHQGLKKCPSGPHKGMPYIKLRECGDSVLGIRLSATGSGAAGFALLGSSLIGLGVLLLRLRRPRAVA